MLQLTVYLMVFTTAVLAVMNIYEYIFSPRNQVVERLQLILKTGEQKKGEYELKEPCWERLCKPVFKSLGNGLSNLTPQGIRQNIEKKIIYAGNPYNMGFNSFISLQVLLAAFFVILALLISWALKTDATKTFLFLVPAVITGVLLPVNMINTRIVQRRQQIQKALPDMLDLLLVSVEAGLSFDMSLKRVTEQATGILSKEINRALEEMRLGKTREEALRTVIHRTGVPDLSSFINAVIQAEQLGVNIANTLRIQAATMRQKRRQLAEETAMKAPIKMLFPLVFFIFPTLFVILLGPAFIKIMHTFSDML
ncbi:MAG: type II secretion system F family protein [Firmicutes bacterium]|nr:type II secretion system F family protein [Bacillota bacterium]